MRKQLVILLFLLVTILLSVFFVFKTQLGEFLYRTSIQTEKDIKKLPIVTDIVTDVIISDQEDIQIIAQNLQIPWDVAFLPGGDMLVTERTGTLTKIGKEIKKIQSGLAYHVGEGGLLGIVLHPKFNENRFLYLYVTNLSNNKYTNGILRFKFEDDKLTDQKWILDGIPGSIYHDGGRMAFGPDGYLYVTVGDAQNENLAQDKNSLAGKILRMTDGGSPAPDNPFGNLVYSYGHRNPQGLAWDSKNRLWATEHGRSGLQSGLDEINLINIGKNYGWPVTEGDEKKDGMEIPILHSGPKNTWAPASLLYYKESLFFGGLRGEALYEYKIESKQLIEHFKNEYGRIRTVVLGPDGFFYITTSNTDGRGDVNEGDDKIIRVNPKMFKL